MWVQVVNFNLNKMGKTPGMCEKNVREGYGLPARCKSAKDDMLFNQQKGTLHKMSELPKNVDVPVFIDTESQYEHIEVSIKGVFYSDKARVLNPNKQKYFGWGEYCAKARVVKKAAEPAKIKIGDSVIVNGQGTANSKGGGAKTKVFKNTKMKVIDIKNGRYGCNQYNKQGAITGWFASSQVKKV